jgi:hypothetical protein
MTWQSSDTDLARAQFCLVLSHALPLDMYAPQDLFLCTSWGWLGDKRGVSAAFLMAPLGIAVQWNTLPFLLASATVAMSKESLANRHDLPSLGVFFFFFFFCSFHFFWGEFYYNC